MILSKCGPCGRAMRADAMWCPQCGAITSVGSRYCKIRAWPWLVVASVWCVFLTVVSLNYQ